MSICNTVIHTKYDLTVENSKKILESLKVNLSKIKKLGKKGTYGTLFSGIFNNKTVAIKVQKIKTNDEKKILEKEVKYQNKAYNIKRFDNKSITIKVHKCYFVCNSKKNCNGLFIIIMERGNMDIFRYLIDSNISLESKCKIIEIMLENFELLIKNKIYLIDIKPENGLILNNNLDDPKIIDFGYKFIVDDITDIIDIKKLSNLIKGKLTKEDLDKIILTIIQLQFVLRCLYILNKIYNKSINSILRKELFYSGSRTNQLFVNLNNSKLLMSIYYILAHNDVYKNMKNQFNLKYKNYLKKLFFKYINSKNEYEVSCNHAHKCEQGFIYMINKINKLKPLIGTIKVGKVSKYKKKSKKLKKK